MEPNNPTMEELKVRFGDAIIEELREEEGFILFILDSESKTFKALGFGCIGCTVAMIAAWLAGLKPEIVKHTNESHTEDGEWKM